VRLRIGRPVCLSSVLLLLIFLVPQMSAADGNNADHEDYDAYTIRFDGFWFYAHPTGNFMGANNSGTFSFNTDVNFQTYSTFVGSADWKFTRKNHLYFEVTPFDQTKTFTATRTIVFRGQTYVVGTSVSGNLTSDAYVPGYQYDIFRRKQWNLGFRLQSDLLNIKGSLNATAQVVNRVPHSAAFSSAKLLVPLPTGGLHARVYLIPNSSRLFVTGSGTGVYFLGYGNYWNATGTVGLTITKHLSARGGYQVGSSLKINTQTDRSGVRLTQKGALVGLEVSF
jgi:hypothetical protein